MFTLLLYFEPDLDTSSLFIFGSTFDVLAESIESAALKILVDLNLDSELSVARLVFGRLIVCLFKLVVFAFRLREGLGFNT